MSHNDLTWTEETIRQLRSRRDINAKEVERLRGIVNEYETSEARRYDASERRIEELEVALRHIHDITQMDAPPSRRFDYIVEECERVLSRKYVYEQLMRQPAREE